MGSVVDSFAKGPANDEQIANTMRLSLSLSLSAALVMASADPARADDWAFEWLEIEPPSGYTLATVHDVNNLGHILCRVKKASDNHYYGAIFRDEAWHILDISPSGTDDIWVTDINNEGTVVGYSGVNADLKGRAWSWNAQNGTYDGGADLGAKLQIWSINDFGEMAGFDVDGNEVVGWLAEWEGWTPLNPLENGDSTAAFGLNHDGPPATVVGLATEKIGQAPTVTWAVAWIGSVNPTKFDPNQSDQTQTPYVINDNGWIVGSRVSGSSYAYILWRPDGEGGWGNAASLGTITGSNPKAVGLNNSNEVVAKKTLFYEDGQGALQSVSLTSISGIPLGTSVGQYNSTNMAFYAVNDDGWIVGKAGRYIDATNQVQTVLLLVPFDRDNDETPDYREIIADPTLDTNDDWVLDSTTKMRVGLYAINVGSGTDNLVQDVDNITAVRLHGNYELINRILTNPPEDPNACQSFRALLSYLGGHQSQGHQGKEIILMIRTPWPTNENLDYIPDAQTQEAMLADLRCFVSKYAYDIDAIQFGNEIFGGLGQYYVDLGGGCTGTLGSLTDSACYIAACEAVFEWMQKQADAVREASALAGRPLQMITPAVFYGQVNTGYEEGSIEPPLESEADRNAYAVQCAVAFGNRNGAAVDIHLHYRDAEQRAEMYSGVDRLLEGNSGQQQNIWDPPFAITALEWSPVPKTDWLLENQGPLSTYFQSNPNLVETTWEQFFDGWARATFTEPERTMEDLIDEDLAAFNGLLRHACYGEYGQPQSGSLDQWDITVVRANRVHSGDLPWMLETNYEKLTNVAKGLAASGASYLPTDPFNPHPNTPFDGDCGCD